jgi:hypothetical protein
MKLITWCGDSLERVREFPEEARRKAGHQLIEDARRVKRALDLLLIPLLAYVIVGEGVTSLLQRRVI